MKNVKRKMAKGDNRLRFLAPIGTVPPEDKDLDERINNLPEGATIADVLQEITAWEDSAVRKFKTHERTAESGILETTCR